MNDILLMMITVFVTQVIFIWARTWNVRSISNKNMKDVLLSGAVVHLAWLVSITLGVVSFKEIMLNFQWQYLPVIVGSLSGGLIGSYLGLKEKLKK
jgi:hypothetical protein